MDLVDAIDALYTAPLGEFVATRTALARAARADKRRDDAATIAALRKPSVAAWALNALARDRPDVVAAFAGLGVRLRDAQSRLDAPALTALRPERDSALEEFVAATVQVAAAAGVALSASARDDVRDTGVAALADADAQDAVSSGHLTRTLSYAGFGEVDLDDAVAPAPRGHDATPAHRASAAADLRDETAESVSDAPRGQRSRLTATPDGTDNRAGFGTEHEAVASRHRRQAAQEHLDAAERRLADARLSAAHADDAARRAAQRVDELAALLDRARADADTACTAARDATSAAQEAHMAATAARNALAALGT